MSSVGRWGDLRKDRIEQIVQVSIDIFVSDAHDLPTSRFHELVAAHVMSSFGLARMRRTIHFEYKLRRNTRKIRNIGTDRMLAPEVNAVFFAKLQTRPQYRLGLRQSPT